MRTMTKRLWNNGRKADGGYTLIEMALVVSVVGLIMASFISAYSLYKKTKAQQDTEDHISIVTARLSNFLVQTGRYPCPARIDVNRTSNDFGMETECNSAAPGYPVASITPAPSSAAGTCTAGLCYETGLATVDMLPDPANVCPLGCAVPKVRRGGVPFRALGLTEEQAQDGWGNRLQYAITENLAVQTSYVRTSGGIQVRDGSELTGNLLTNANNLAHYVVFSSGPDRAGAYSSDGVQMTPCPTAGLDRANCNTTANPLAVYASSPYSPIAGATHFDDYIQFFSAVESPLWKVSDAAGFDIRDTINAGPASGQIGIGAPPNTANAIVDVSGEVRAADADVKASEVCDPGQNNCFPIEKFAGDDPAFKCPDGYYAQGFGGVSSTDGTVPAGKYVKCVQVSQTRCPPGSVMTGVDFATSATGTPVCATVTGCPAKTFRLCNATGAQVDYTVPAGPAGPSTTSCPQSSTSPYCHVTPTIGSSFWASYLCSTQSTGTIWRQKSSGGSCTCTPLDEYTDQACNAYKGFGNWTGVVTTHRVRTCPANTLTSTISANTCTCAPTSETYNDPCPTGQTGNITMRRDWVCDSATAGHWNAPVQIGNTCTCTPRTETDNPSCPDHHDGSITRHRNITCPGPVTGNWIEDVNTCTCRADTMTETGSCPEGNTGSIQYTRTWQCPGGGWGPLVETGNSCSCTGGTQTRPKVCPGDIAHLGGSITEQRTYNCATTSWGNWTEISNDCHCVPGSPEQRTTACPAPLLGNITEERTYNCGTGGWGSWYEIQNNCGTVAYAWAAKTAATGPFGSPLAVQQGAACSTPGTNSSCSAPAGGGQYWHFSNCQCE